MVLQVESDGPVRRLTLNRPERRNALNPELSAAIHAAVRAADADPDCRVLTIRGAAGNFCAGRDLSGDMAPKPLDEIMAADRQWADIFRILDRSHVVSVAIVEGYAVAGGFTLAMGCDFVLSEKTARFGAAEMRNGFPAAVNTPILMHLVGRRLALELAMFGDMVSAERLWQMGLVNALADGPEALDALGADWSGRLLGLGTEAVRLTKENHRLARTAPLSEALTAGAQQNALLNTSGLFREGAERFRQAQAEKKGGG
ncbi:MAG: enoyl-CoA hydratase/isomerase family protein [Minwuia sp.]|uniref:enoyl-CoA hydratase/isomerase family protein n=1 Tax=Minwuia sp. TaxID=2493630 RepID=UPI003A8C3CA2